MKSVFLRACEKPAIAGRDFSISHLRLYEEALDLSKKLPPRPERVAIFAENSPAWAAALYAVWIAGGAAVPADAAYSAEELAFVLGDSKSRAVFADSSLLKTAKAALSLLKNSPVLVEIGAFSEKREGADGGNPPAGDGTVARGPEETALIVYTSGTTGTPKGVVLSFENLKANMDAVEKAGYYFPGVRALAMLPFHHILPLMGTLIMPISMGGKTVLPSLLDPGEISAALKANPVDIAIAVPRFYELLRANVKAKISESKTAKFLFFAARVAGSRRLSQMIFHAVHSKFGGRIKFWISGGAALDPDVWRDLETLGFGVREGYGMTECAPIIAFPRIGETKCGSVGRALPGIEIKITSEGEIAVRGPNVTKGYFGRPEETAQSIRDGWLYTGDLGRMDANGFLFITGRRKEIMVLANGKNVDPSEIESALSRQIPGALGECAVFVRGKILCAALRPTPEFARDCRSGAEIMEKLRREIILPYNRNAPSYKRIIRAVAPQNPLPRTRVGKLKRHLLGEVFEACASADPGADSAPEPEGEVYRRLKGFLSDQLSLPVRADAHMEMDLGLDSLGKISLRSFVEENFGVDVEERDFDSCGTLRRLASHVEEKGARTPKAGAPKTVDWASIINAEPAPKIAAPNFLHFATIIFLRTLCGLCYRLKTKGFEKSALPDSPQIIAPNHQSYLDAVFVVQKFSKTQLYKTYFFAKLRKILRGGPLRKFAERSNVIIMDTNSNVGESLRKLARALKLGNKIVLFPEGTRTRDGTVSEFRQSFAILARETGAPVVPVAIRGAYEALKPGATFPRFGAKVEVDYLPEMRIGKTESLADFSARVRDAVVSALEGGR